MNGVRSHLHVLTHANIYLDVLSSHVQNFIWRVNFFFYSLPSVSITNSFIIFFLQIYKRYTSVAFTCFFCRPLGDCNKNRLYKDFCRIKNKQTHSFHISAQQTNTLRLKESLWMDAWSSRLGFTSLNVLPICLLSKTSL